jgi:hypothetical protein
MTDNTKTLAWHNDPDLKDRTVARMRMHQAYDEIEPGRYRTPDPTRPSGFRGCFLGCVLPNDVDTEMIRMMITRSTDSVTAPGGWHSKAIRLLGFPIGLILTAEAIFEDIAVKDAPAFAVAVLEAVPVGADLTEIDRLGMKCHWEGGTPSEGAHDFLEALRHAPVSAPAVVAV